MRLKLTISIILSIIFFVGVQSVALAVTSPTNTTNKATNNSNAAPKNTNSGSSSDYVGKNDPPLTIDSPIKAKTVAQAIRSIINLALSLIAMVAVIVIIIAGFRMVTGGGNADQIKKAKSSLVWAILGLVLALMSFSIVAIVVRLIQK